MSNTLGQQRADFTLQALRKNLAGKGNDKKTLREEFSSFTAGLPAMILQNGFGQTLAFLLVKATDSKTHKFKKNDKHYVAYSIITDWIARNEYVKKGNEDTIISQISKMNQDDYLQAQREALAMLEWLKRFANAALFFEGGK